MVKLTRAQRRALTTLPVSITTWGGKPFAGMPEGIRNRGTLWALQKLGLVTITYLGSRENWRITTAGRAALADGGRDDG